MPSLLPKLFKDSYDTDHIVLWDTEYWTDEGVQERRWGGLNDYPPVLCQMGAIKVRLDAALTIVDEYDQLVIPLVAGKKAPITPFFTSLTGLTPEQFDADAVKPAMVIHQFINFIGNCRCFSYGRDDFSTLLPTCHANGIETRFDYNQFHNFKHLALKAGMSQADIVSNSSGTLATFLGLKNPKEGQVHNAIYDATSLLVALRYFLSENRLTLDDIRGFSYARAA